MYFNLLANGRVYLLYFGYEIVEVTKRISNHRISLWLLLICASVMILIGHGSIEVLDRDEARFAQASKQMVQTADIITVRFQEELRAKKPIGIYWLQSASASLFGSDKISSYRFPSLIGYILSIVLSFLFVKNLWPDSGYLQQIVPSSLLACSLIILAEAHIAKTDSILLSLILAQQFSLWLCYKNRFNINASSSTKWFWISMGFAILVKGPIAPFLAFVTIFGLIIIDRDWSWLKRLNFLSGLVIIGIICLPWVLAVSFATEGVFLSQAIQSDFLPKLISGQESHGAPPGLYLLTILLFVFPASIFFGALFRTNAQFWRSDASRFCLIWLLSYWLIIELIPTKLPHYILPIIPALMMLIGRAIFIPISKIKWRRTAEIVISLLSCLFGVLLLVGGLWASAKFGAENGAFAFAFVIFGMLLVGGIFFASFKWIRNDTREITTRGQYIFLACILGIIFNCIFFSGIIGNLKSLHVASLIEEKLERLPVKTKIIALAGYHEPSSVFKLGEDILLLNADEAALLLAEAPEALIIVESRQIDQFKSAASNLNVVYHQSSQIKGFNISKGQFIELYLMSSIKFDDKDLNS